MNYELAVVMPVYNEEACIGDVVAAWHEGLSDLRINFIMIVLNDGSRDQTEERLSQFALSSRIKVINKTNSGHGPTILKGYHMGVGLAEWVFQVDSDDEMKPRHFKELWSRRHDFDALFGFRHGRSQSSSRSFISYGSRMIVGAFFGRGVRDVNTPYRLMRSQFLKQAIRYVPDNTFAPNIIISGELAVSGSRIYNHPVPHEGRKTGSCSIVRLTLWKVVCKSFYQTVTIRYFRNKR